MNSLGRIANLIKNATPKPHLTPTIVSKPLSTKAAKGGYEEWNDAWKLPADCKPKVKSSSRQSGGSGGVVVGKEDKLLKGTTKICISIKSFNEPLGLPPHTRRIRLPETRVLYTVNRSPHVDKKSREQFETRTKRNLLIIETTSKEIRNKLFWLKRQKMFDAQYEIQLHCKTRLDKGDLQRLLSNQAQSVDPS